MSTDTTGNPSRIPPRIPALRPGRLPGPVTRWALWALPTPGVAFVVLVDLAAVVLVLNDVRAPSTEPDELLAAAVLAVLGILHTECARGFERLRRQPPHPDGAPHIDLASVWIFAAAVLLPPALFSLVAVVVCTHLWWRAWRPRVPLYRQVFGAATIVLSCHAAWAALQLAGTGGIAELPRSGGELLAMVLAIGAYAVVNSALVAAAIALSAGPDRRGAVQLLGTWGDNMLELATLCLGALTAVALASNPWQVVLMLPPLLVLHRAVHARRLEAVAATDGKTGLLNAAAWHRQGAAELRRAGRSGGVAALLILDLDHFKAVNDDHGHLAGDDALSAVAGALRAEVREHDVVGRFGGEEFVVLLPGLGREPTGRGGAGLHAIAERIRHRIATLTVAARTPSGALTITGLSVSVGGACYPGDGQTMDELLLAADAALAAAKRGGRNSVRITAPEGPSRLPSWARIPVQQDGQGASEAPVSGRRW